jgi:hypothetical protein
LRDAAGNECAFAAALSQPDAVLTFAAPRTGDYFLSLRDLRYQGGPAFFYRLTVGKIPRVTSVFPLGGAAGATVHLTLSGDNLPTPAAPPRAVSLPTEPPLAPLSLPDLGNWRLDVGTLPEAFETEPNDLPGTAQPVTLPITINGRIHAASLPKPDADCFRFTAAKGQVFALEVIAARLGSSLDAVLKVLDTKGKELATNDDARGRDAALTFTAPEAGDYVAQVRDLSGGAAMRSATGCASRPPCPTSRSPSAPIASPSHPATACRSPFPRPARTASTGTSHSRWMGCPPTFA